MIDKLLKLSTRPRFHGNGMVQWYLTETKRLHIWSRQLPVLENHNALIHDHNFHMNSRVLFGLLNHQIVEIQEDEGEHTHRVIQFIPDKRKSAKGVEVMTGRPVIVHAANLHAPSNYFQSSRTFHKSQSLAHLTITLMDKKRDRFTNMARVICPIGQEPTDAVDPERMPSETRMLEVVDAALKEMGPSPYLNMLTIH